MKSWRIAFILMIIVMSNITTQATADEPDRDATIGKLVANIDKRFKSAYHPPSQDFHAKVKCKVKVKTTRVRDEELVQSSGNAEFDEYALKLVSTHIRPSPYEFDIIVDIDKWKVTVELCKK